MAKFEVIAGIYKDGADESIDEEVLLETDDQSEAGGFLADLVADTSEESTEEDPEDVDG